jgi:hypothetical protein
MSLDIGDVTLRFEAPAEGRSAAERVAAELRAALPEALRAALAVHSDSPGVAVVPRLRMHLRAPLSRLRGTDLARRIAEACLEAIVAESSIIGASPSDRDDGTAERTLRALTVLDGVRIDAATEAAAWLIALVRDEQTVLRRVTPYADLEYLTATAAFVEICARAGARAVLVALGSVWAVSLALRCTDDEARRLLGLLDDGSEPTAHTWLMLEALREEEPVPASSGTSGTAQLVSEILKGLTNSGRGSRPGTNVLALIMAIRGVFERYPGAVVAAKALAASPRLPETSVTLPPQNGVETHSEARDVETNSEARLESACTGFWLLLPHLARRLWTFDEETARAITFAVAEQLCGAGAGDDPAISAFTTGLRPEELRLAVPPELRIDRIGVSAVRDFARAFPRFERARCGYVLRAMLAGPGFVWRSSRGWAATMPQSPLRIVLERAALVGPLITPWGEPELTLEDDP